MRFSEIKDELEADILCGEDQMDMEIGVAGGADLIDDISASRSRGSVLLTGLNSIDVVLAAKKAGVEGIVFVRGKAPEQRVIEVARENGMPLLITRFALFVACGRLYMSGLRGLDGSW